jgi:hypothetical protein
MLVGYAGMCLSDQPALFSFALPQTCIGSILSLQLVSDWVAARNVVPSSVPSLPRCLMLAGYVGMCPSYLSASFSFALPRTCIRIPSISAVGE